MSRQDLTDFEWRVMKPLLPNALRSVPRVDDRRALIQEQDATPDIPPQNNRRWKPCFGKRIGPKRNMAERSFSELIRLLPGGWRPIGWRQDCGVKSSPISTAGADWVRRPTLI